MEAGNLCAALHLLCLKSGFSAIVSDELEKVKKKFQQDSVLEKISSTRTINQVQVFKQLKRKQFKSTVTSSKSVTLYSTLEPVP